MKATFSSGGVLFSIDAEGREDVREALEAKEEGQKGWHQVFGEAFDGLLCNGWEWLAPEDIGALTDAPILSNCIDRDDDGAMTAHSGCGLECGIFWFPNYMVEDPLETLRDKGEVFFTRAV